MSVLPTRLPMVRRIVLPVTTGLLLCGVAAVPAGAGTDVSAVAAYASITTETYATSPVTNTLPSSRSFSTAGGWIDVTRAYSDPVAKIGPYIKLVFHNLAVGVSGSDPGGVVHVRGASYGTNCNTSNPMTSGVDVIVNVACWQTYNSAQVFTPFTVNYTRGITESGGLATARADGFMPVGQVVTPVTQTNSAAGKITVMHNTTGRYTVDVSGPGAGGTPALTGVGGGNSRCGMLNLGTSVGSAIRFFVQCVNASTGLDKDAHFNFTYAVGTNLLGEYHQVSASYGYIPATAFPSFGDQPALIQFDRIYGDKAGKVTFDKQSTVDLVRLTFGHQGEGMGNPQFTITPIGSMASCVPWGDPITFTNAGHVELRLWVQCNTTVGDPPFAFFVQQWVRQ